MADSSEIKSKPDAEIQQRKRDQQDSSFLETLVPIPDFFFNIKAEIGNYKNSCNPFPHVILNDVVKKNY